jgi:hypothetical protein
MQEEIKHENEEGNRLLQILQQDNVLLKNKLSEILKLNTRDGILEKAENFQTNFLLADERISFLRKDNTELGRQFLKATGDKSLIEELSQKQWLLKKQIRQEEREFNKMKSAFNNYIVSIIKK